MFDYLRNKFATIQLHARYQRLVQERLVQLTESSGPVPVETDSHGWQQVGQSSRLGSISSSSHLRDQVRKLVRMNPHACNILRLLESYVTGPGLSLSHRQFTQDSDKNLVEQADRIWKRFLLMNEGHYSFREHARRTWRDGECFLQRFPHADHLHVRFVDPESIRPTQEHPESEGILTTENDAETAIAYLRHDPSQVAQHTAVDASDMLQTRIGIDSNEKRGVSLFAPLVEPLNCFQSWMETELLARKLQSSIVLWRKVNGSPQTVDALNNQQADEATRRERIQPGTILTTNSGTDIQFLQPNTNFGDAASLGRMLLLNIAAGAGLPEFMLTSDASNANFASTMVAEGPAVKFFQSEQSFFGSEFTRLWRWVMEHAVANAQLPEDFFEQISPNWSFPQLVNRDRARERTADARLVSAGILSKAEVARRDGVDPVVMQAERQAESEQDPEATPSAA